jgi:hypothetical protein
MVKFHQKVKLKMNISKNQLVILGVFQLLEVGNENSKSHQNHPYILFSVICSQKYGRMIKYLQSFISGLEPSLALKNYS